MDTLARRYAELAARAPLAQELPSVRNWVERRLGAADTRHQSQAQRVARAATDAKQIPVAPDAPAQDTSARETIRRGVLLQRQPVPEPAASPWTLMPGMLLIGLLLAGGAVHQSMRARRPARR